MIHVWELPEYTPFINNRNLVMSDLVTDLFRISRHFIVFQTTVEGDITFRVDDLFLRRNILRKFIILIYVPESTVINIKSRLSSTLIKENTKPSSHNTRNLSFKIFLLLSRYFTVSISKSIIFIFTAFNITSTIFIIILFFFVSLFNFNI